MVETQAEKQVQPSARKTDVESNSDHNITQAPSRFHSYSRQELSPKHVDLALLACFFCTGLIDSGSFEIYSSFVGMQTGNTIFVALGAAGLPRSAPQYNWTKSLVAIVCFSLGAIFFSSFHRILGGTKRWVMIASFAIEAFMVLVIAIVVTAGVVSNKPPSVVFYRDNERSVLVQEVADRFPWSDLAPIAVLAFQSAGQIVASRVLKVGSMPTVVVTSLLCDLFSDARVFTAKPKDNIERNRRLGGVVLLFVGGVVGGLMSKSWVGFAGCLWLATFIKICLVVAWTVWKAKPEVKL